MDSHKEVLYVIHLEYNPQTWEYKVDPQKTVAEGVTEIFHMLTSQYIPLTSPPHALFYDSEQKENVKLLKGEKDTEDDDEERLNHPKLHKEASLVIGRSSSRSSDIVSPRPEGVDEPVTDAERVSSWIGGIQDRDRRLQKRESRSSSFNMMNPMQFVSINTEVQLSLEKRFYSCNLPNGAHLTFKSIPEISDEKPVFTGKKQFVRVYDRNLSYKTLFPRVDTNAKYLYEDLAEKFNLTDIENFRLFLYKRGVEIILADNSLPIKLIAEMEDGDSDDVRLIFKDAGAKKVQSAEIEPRKATTESIVPLLSSIQEETLDLSFHHVEEFPPEFFNISGVSNLTFNQAEISSLPSLVHLNTLKIVRLVNNSFKAFPKELLEISTLTEIDLGNNLIKSIPDDIAKLPHLQEFHIYVNQVTNISEGLLGLQSLRVLNISNNYIESIPKDITKLQNLVQLKASKNCLKEIPDELCELPELVDLNVSRNKISKIPESISKLAKLRWLDIHENEITIIPESISNLTVLEELIASNNKLSTLPKMLPSVKTLLVDHNEINELPPELSLEKITVFDISHNRIENIKNEIIMKMKQLSKISLAFNDLKYLPEMIGKLHHLTQIDCKHNQILKLPDLGDMHLKVFDCASNQLATIPTELLCIPSLWFVNTANNPLKSLYMNFYDEGLETDIYCGMTRLKSEHIELFSQMRNLKSLDLAYGQLKTIPTSFIRLQRLLILSVNGNLIKSLPKEIGKLANLTELYASCNQISSLPSTFHKLKKLKILDLGCNNLSKVSELSKLKNLRWIDLSYNPNLKSIPKFDDIEQNLMALHVFGCPKLTSIPSKLHHYSHINMTPSERFVVSVADMRGRRDTMEDSMVIRGKFTGNPDWDFFCVLDGHGGQRVAEFGGEELASRIEHLLIKTNCKNPADVLNVAFHKVQEAVKDTRIGIMEGATIVLALFLGKELYIANAGDSRAVLSRGGHAMRLSFDHKPDCPEEEDRICKLGGFVSDGRVNSVLAVSRVIGDFALEKWISSTPYIQKVEIGQDDEFLIIACDGVWDVMEDQIAVNYVARCQNPIRAAPMLRNYAHVLGSMDNISCCVVHLKQ